VGVRWEGCGVSHYVQAEDATRIGSAVPTPEGTSRLSEGLLGHDGVELIRRDLAVTVRVSTLNHLHELSVWWVVRGG